MNNQPSLLNQMNNDLNQQNQSSLSYINNTIPSQAGQPEQAGNVGIGDVASANGATQGADVQAPQNGRTPSWIEKLLPTIGGTLGSIGGAFIPGLGQIGVGEAAGGAAGSAVGQGLENLLTGKKSDGSDIAGSAVEGGIGGVGGKLLGGVVGGAGKLLSNTGGKAIESAAGKAAANEAVNTAQATKNTFAGIKPSFLKANDLSGTQELAGKLGIDANSPQALAQTGNSANDILNDTVNGVLSKNGGVDTNGLNDLFRNAIGKNAGTLGGVQPVALAKGRMGLPNTPGSKLYQQLQDLSAGLSNRAEADPTELRSMISKVGALAADAKPGISATTGAVDPTQKAMYNTLNDIYGQLKNTLYNRPGVSKDISEMVGGIKPEDVGGNELLANHLNEAISGAQNPQDLLDHLSKFTGMSKIGNAAMESANNPATAAAVNAAKQEAAKLEGTSLDSMGNPISDVAANAKHPIVSAVGHAMNVVGNGGAGSQGAVKIGDTLQRFAPALGAAGAQTAANSPSTQGAAGANTAVGQGGIVQPSQGSQGGLSDILNNQSPGAQILKMDLINAMHPMVGQTSTGLTAGDQAEASNLQKVSSAQSELANLTNLLNQSGGAQGPVGGFLSNLGAQFTGGPAAQYGKQAEQLTSQLNQLLGTNVQAPSMMMNQQTANDVLGQLQQALISQGSNGGQSSL